MSDATPGSGDAVKISNVRPNGFVLKNDTCSDYWLRVHVQVPSLPPENRSTTSNDRDGGGAGAVDD